MKMKILLRHIVFPICGFMMVIMIPSSAWAQDSLANYHPLGKGNVWIYQISHLGGGTEYQRYEVKGDSMIEGKNYRIIVETNMSNSGSWISVERYDSSTGSYFVRSGNIDVLQDSVVISTPNRTFSGNRRILKAFGSNLVFGTQRASRQISEYALIKEDAISWRYSYGLGLVYAEDLQLFTLVPSWVQTLAYAKIDGIEYGTIPLSVENRTNDLPTSFVLAQNYPNPFNPATKISFALPKQAFVTLKIYDVMGREVAGLVSGHLAAGIYSREWNASGMPSGVYFYRLTAGGLSETKKLMLAK